MEMADRGVIPAADIRIGAESTKLMTDTIIDSTNAVVKEDDTLVIAGDVLFAPREQRFETAKQLLSRIRCRNRILIWGNHDDRKLLAPLFQQTYDQFMFNVDGQKIFVNHYPMRSWDCAHHGAWMLYGHVHNLYRYEDNGQVSPHYEKWFTDGFAKVLDSYNLVVADPQQRANLLRDLVAVVAAQNGIDMTLDIGVDNTIRENVPWGTPWSMDDLRKYMFTKLPKWQARQAAFRESVPPSSLKGSPETAHPKF